MVIVGIWFLIATPIIASIWNQERKALAMASKGKGWLRHLCRTWWVSWCETSAVLSGVPIEIDADESGDRFARSPLITEVHTQTREVREIRASGKLRGL